jgi:hypothetical protein
VNASLEDVAAWMDPVVRGWWNYYGAFAPWECRGVLDYINDQLVRWARRKYKRFRRHAWRAWRWLGRIAAKQPGLLALWQLGVVPTAGR